MNEEEKEAPLSMEEVRPEKALEVTKVTKRMISVEPSLFERVVRYIETSIPTTNSVAEVNALLNSLKTTSFNSDITFNGGAGS
jgi:hypothetical protein